MQNKQTERGASPELISRTHPERRRRAGREGGSEEKLLRGVATASNGVDETSSLGKGLRPTGAVLALRRNFLDR